MNPHRTNDPARRAEHIARQAGNQAYYTFMRELHTSGLRTEDPLQVHIDTYNQAIIELAGNTNNQLKGIQE